MRIAPLPSLGSNGSPSWVVLTMCGLAWVACAIDDRAVNVDGPPGFGLVPGASGMGADTEVQRLEPGGGEADGAPGPAALGSGGTPSVTEQPEATFALSASERLDFGATEVGTEGSTLDWTVTYAAENGESSGALYVSSSNFTDFVHNSGCEAPLAPGASCTLSLTFRPRTPGALSATLRVTAASGASTEVELLGNSRVRLTVTRTGTRAGTVASRDSLGIDCGDLCTAVFDAGQPITLDADTENDSNSFFAGWSALECAGPNRTCRLVLNESRTIEAEFAPMVSNLAFVTSEAFPASLGSVAAYDAECNALASAAGINDGSGSAYIAAMSTAALGLRDRLLGTGARGWLRLDGLPVADTVTELFGQGRILHPVKYTERGGTESADMMLGTDTDGSLASNCEDWSTTSPDASLLGGSSTAGPVRWMISFAGSFCAEPLPILCLGVTRSNPVIAPAQTGKRIWLTNTPYVIGGMSPDEHCTQDRPAGVAAGVALLAYANRAASALLATNRTYVRPDGQAVGTGRQIIERKLLTGIWQHGDGRYPDGNTGIEAWTGSFDPTLAGELRLTCDDWQLTTGDGSRGIFAEASEEFWGNSAFPCTAPAYLYCFEP